ncbi:hypothetical protein Egran_00919 [Elaphomyces granulatus]|uniref:Carboxylesterase type B domain-containing protein n=1 Tax=Elaphomyces granulatus TaxID=519963 RepID=A0A232M4G1_9EURO|nr:hypothetical protein Egran_00919 [Elaphomyces granulatus]
MAISLSSNFRMVYTFRNIRYAAPPTGPLRWAKPSPPKPLDPENIQDGSYGPNCIPAPLPPAFSSPLFDDLPKTADEDIYVPGKVLRDGGQAKKTLLPVIAWIHGGGYISGSKDQVLQYGIYNGTNLIQCSNGSVIVVTMNYRLSAFGFLAGTTMETHALPNAGLHDQRAALHWIQNYIALVGGDPSNVSAWGQSAGGASIMHHLVAHGGTLDPLFRRAVILSPGFGPAIDRRGAIEEEFRSFATAAECATEDNDVMTCLRNANISLLKDANENAFIGGPAPDGWFIRQAVSVEYSQGNIWNPIQSIIVSHVIDEGSLFLFQNGSNNNSTFLDDYLQSIIPKYAQSGDIIPRIKALYKTAYPDQDMASAEMAITTIRDVLFTCNIRNVIDAYSSSSSASSSIGHTRDLSINPTIYAVQYSLPPGTHGVDVPALWHTDSLQESPSPFNNTTSAANIMKIWTHYQTYLISHARSRTGNPNTFGDGYNPIEWPTVQPAEYVGNTLNVTETGDGFEIIDDVQVRMSVSRMWNGVWEDITRLGGYAV